MVKIGLISDTHSYLDDAVFKHFENCDELWHAGDFGSMEVIEQLQAFKPLKGVYGNIDGKEIRDIFPENLRFKCEGVDVWMTHIGGYPGTYIPRVKKILDRQPPQIFICGHSHILKVVRDPAYYNMLVINPGAAGIQGFHQVKTLIRFTLDSGKITNMEAIEMGKRGEIK